MTEFRPGTSPPPVRIPIRVLGMRHILGLRPVMRHSEKRVLVAGGTGALGSAVALGFLEQGATVVVAARRRDGYDALLATAGNDRERLSAAFVDVADAGAAAKLAGELVERHGRLDVL